MRTSKKMKSDGISTASRLCPTPADMHKSMDILTSLPIGEALGYARTSETRGRTIIPLRLRPMESRQAFGMKRKTPCNPSRLN